MIEKRGARLAGSHRARALLKALGWPLIFRPGRKSDLPIISAIYRNGTKTFRRARAPKPDFTRRQSHPIEIIAAIRAGHTRVVPRDAN